MKFTHVAGGLAYFSFDGNGRSGYNREDLCGWRDYLDDDARSEIEEIQKGLDALDAEEEMSTPKLEVKQIMRCGNRVFALRSDGAIFSRSNEYPDWRELPPVPGCGGEE